MTTPALEVVGLRKTYTTSRRSFRPARQHTVVRDVTLHVARGETLAVVGESGAGKSTLARLVLRLTEPDSGSVKLDGLELTGMTQRELRPVRRRIQCVFQDPYGTLDPKVSVGASIEEPMLLHLDLDPRSRFEAAIGLLERVGLRTDHFDRYPYELSGGQLQRVGIARAIATQPEVVICDEPVAALDMSVRAQVLNLLRDLQVERQVAYLFISHDLSLVRLIAHRVAVMYAGRIVEQGPTDAIFGDSQHPYTKRLLSAILVADPSKRRLSATPPGPRDERVPDVGCPYVPRCPCPRADCSTAFPAAVTNEAGVTFSCHAVAVADAAAPRAVL